MQFDILGNVFFLSAGCSDGCHAQLAASFRGREALFKSLYQGWERYTLEAPTSLLKGPILAPQSVKGAVKL